MRFYSRFILISALPLFILILSGNGCANSSIQNSNGPLELPETNEIIENELPPSSVKQSIEKRDELLKQRNQKSEQWPVFKGAWFDISYPPGFTARPSLLYNPNSLTGGYDSVFFVSPDQTVEFYVLSPLWTRDPTDLILTPNEKIVSEKIQEAPRDSYQRIIWRTIKATDGNYARSYVDRRASTLGFDVPDVGAYEQTVFGIKYKNQEIYEKYKNDYTHFKQSLIQYSD